MKKRLRYKLLKRRDAIPPELKSVKDSSIEKRLFSLEAFRKSKIMLMYASFRSEVDTTRFLPDILGLGKQLILPVVDVRHKILKLYYLNKLSDLKPGYMGIPEPDINMAQRASLKDVDLVVIPGTGFDCRGNRLGYGGGYYDKLLSYESKQLEKVGRHIPTIALAFEEQIGDEIPSEPHDIKVDMIVTDKRLIHCDV